MLSFRSSIYVARLAIVCRLIRRSTLPTYNNVLHFSLCSHTRSANVNVMPRRLDAEIASLKSDKQSPRVISILVVPINASCPLPGPATVPFCKRVMMKAAAVFRCALHILSHLLARSCASDTQHHGRVCAQHGSLRD